MISWLLLVRRALGQSNTITVPAASKCNGLRRSLPGSTGSVHTPTASRRVPLTSDTAAHRTAPLYSLLRTAAQHSVPPLPYLTDVLQCLAYGWDPNELDELLPDRCKQRSFLTPGGERKKKID
jgi:hypothetical protein